MSLDVGGPEALLLTQRSACMRALLHTCIFAAMELCGRTARRTADMHLLSTRYNAITDQPNTP